MSESTDEPTPINGTSKTFKFNDQNPPLHSDAKVFILSQSSKLFEPLRDMYKCNSCCCGAFKIKGFENDGAQPTLWLDLLFFLREASESIPFNYLEIFMFVQNIFLCMLSTEK